tara:strand:+ start:724 stop:2112 length:1389 start_codon:yes stop_codon:yes gene_type:complete
MWLLDGTNDGKKINKRQFEPLMVNVTGKEIVVRERFRKSLKHIISVDIVSQESKTTTGGGTQGAAAGAVLGFLIAGPLGTAVGAGLGSKSKQVGRDNTTIAIGFQNGDSLICENASTGDLGKLKTALAQNLISPKENIENKRSIKPSSDKIQRKIAKRRKPPSSQYWRINTKKGRDSFRNPKDKRQPSLPKLEIINKLNFEDPIHKRILDDLDRYNLFIWSHFDALISTNEEFLGISSRVLQNLFTLSNQKNELTKQLEDSEKNIEKINKNILSLEAMLNEANINLTQASLFSKGKFKKEISEIGLKIKKEKDSIPNHKRKRTSSVKQLEQMGNLRELPDLTARIEELNKEITPTNKLNPKLKKVKEIDDQFLLDIYLSVFNKLENLRIKKEQERLDEAYEIAIAKKAKEKEIVKEKQINKANVVPNQSVKQRLKELKELLDEGILEKNEYEIQRKRILESI